MSLVPANDISTDRLEEAGAWCMRIADGELSPRDRECFEAWLAEESENLAAFERTVRVWHQFGDGAAAPEAIALRSKALEAFRSANRKRWAPSLNRPLLAALALAASLVLLIVPGAVWYSSLPTVYQTEVGERELAVLADGSRISLDADTRLDVRIRDEQRELVLKSGRAKFDVAKDPLRPFSVRAGDKVIVAIGTSFSVELLQSAVHVVLHEGKVSVLDAAETGSRTVSVRMARADEPESVLKPGEELIVSQNGNSAVVLPADPERALSWESGQLTFVDEPLQIALERVNRYSRKKVQLGDSEAGKLPVNGVYNAGDVEAFVIGVDSVLPVRVADRGSAFVISSSRSRN